MMILSYKREVRKLPDFSNQIIANFDVRKAVRNSPQGVYYEAFHKTKGWVIVRGGDLNRYVNRARYTQVSYEEMIKRSRNPNSRNYKHYGAIGITVCERWADTKLGCMNFIEDMGYRPFGTTLGRYLDLGNYKQENCKWMTPKEQGAEKRKKNVLLKASRLALYGMPI